MDVEIDFAAKTDRLGVITLNRPAKLNAFTREMTRRLCDILAGPDVQNMRSVVIMGAGRAFSAGLDLHELDEREGFHALPDGPELMHAFRQCRAMIIAAVHGYALGLGAMVAMSADLVVADEDAQFGYPQLEHGLVPTGGVLGLRQVVGQRVAMELIATGRRVDASEALRLGMVNEVVAGGGADSRALAIAEQIASTDPFALASTKRFFYQSADLPYAGAAELARLLVETGQCVRASRSVPG